MAFITVSGIRVPVVSGSSSRTLEDAGRASRGVTGQLSKSRLFLRRLFEFKTAPMTYADYISLRGILHRSPAIWRFENSLSSNMALDTTASNAAYTSNIAADGQAVLGASAYGRYAIEPYGVTTNIWATSVATNIANGTDTLQNTTGFSTIGTATIASDTVRYWQGTRSLRMQSTAQASGFRTQAFSGNMGASYAASFYVTGTAQPLLCELWANSTLLSSATVTPISLTWQRVKLPPTVAAPASPTDIHVKITQSGATGGAFFFDGFQLENAGYATPWVNGSRGVITNATAYSTGALDLFGTREGFTVSARVQKFKIPGVTVLQVCNREGYNSPYPGLVLGAVTQQGLTVTHSGLIPAMSITTDAQVNVTLPAPTAPNWGTDDNAFHQLAAVVAPKPTRGAPSMSLYFDGVLTASSTADISGLSSRNMRQVYFGTEGGNYPLSAPLDDVAIFPYPLSPVAVRALHDAGQVSASWPLQSLSGDAVGGGTVWVSGAIEKMEFVTARIGGLVHNNAVQAGLTFKER
jgi:hypothetical protein